MELKLRTIKYINWSERYQYSKKRYQRSNTKGWDYWSTFFSSWMSLLHAGRHETTTAIFFRNASTCSPNQLYIIRFDNTDRTLTRWKVILSVGSRFDYLLIGVTFAFLKECSFNLRMAHTIDRIIKNRNQISPPPALLVGKSLAINFILCGGMFKWEIVFNIITFIDFCNTGTILKLKYYVLCCIQYFAFFVKEIYVKQWNE